MKDIEDSSWLCRKIMGIMIKFKIYVHREGDSGKLLQIS